MLPLLLLLLLLLLLFFLLIINFLLTEREGRTGEYLPEVVAVRREVKNDRGPIFPSTARASPVSE